MKPEVARVRRRKRRRKRKRKTTKKTTKGEETEDEEEIYFACFKIWGSLTKKV